MIGDGISDAASPYDGLAADYNRARPGYPDEALGDLAGTEGLVLDVGSGTGIFTRQLARRLPGATVLGIEPSADMRREAEAASAGLPNIGFRVGAAERLPFPDSSAALLTAATAVHWFDRPAFYAEAFRCLHPGGRLAIVQNLRRWWESAFLADYERLHESTVAGYRRGTFPAFDGSYRAIDIAAELAACGEVADVSVRDLAWRASLAERDFVHFSLSSTITQRAVAAVGRADYLDRLSRLFSDHAVGGLVAIEYLTRVIIAKRGAQSDRNSSGE